MQLSELFPVLSSRRLLIGVVHLHALPGAPDYGGAMDAVLHAAQADAQALVQGGADGIIVENFGDRPFYGDRVPPETVAAMAVALQSVTQVAGDLPVGANVLRNDARSALALVAATAASFLRVNVHSGAAITDQGVLTGRAAETVRERRRLGLGTGGQGAILADVHVKHASPLGSESIEQAALDAWHRGMVEGLVVSGSGTGAPANDQDVQRIRQVLPSAPILLGSGVTLENVATVCRQADGAFVGTSIKRDGVLAAPIDADRVRQLAESLQAMGPAPCQGA